MSDDKTVYYSPQSKAWHEDPECSGIQDADVVAAAPDEIPDNKRPCTLCAGGLKPQDVIEIGNRVRGGADE